MTDSPKQPPSEADVRAWADLKAAQAQANASGQQVTDPYTFDRLAVEAFQKHREEAEQAERDVRKNFVCVHHGTPLGLVCPTCVKEQARAEERAAIAGLYCQACAGAYSHIEQPVRPLRGVWVHNMTRRHDDEDVAYCHASEIHNRTRKEEQHIKLTCAFCGSEYPAEGASPKLLGQHVRVCASHPMREVEAQRDRLRVALSNLIVWASIAVEEGKFPTWDAIHPARAALAQTQEPGA